MVGHNRFEQGGSAAVCIRVSPTGLDAQRSMAAEKEAIEAFAQANGIEIVGEYIDEDDGRLASPALKRLVADARFPECNFRTVLVYEMSRSTPGGYAPHSATNVLRTTPGYHSAPASVIPDPPQLISP